MRIAALLLVTCGAIFAQSISPVPTKAEIGLGNVPNTDPATLYATIANAGAWTKYTLTISGSNFLINGGSSTAKAAALTQSLTLTTLPANAAVEKIRVKHSTAFSGTSVTAVTASLGTTGTESGYGAPFDILAATSATNMYQVAGALGLTTASHALVLTITTVGANVSALTAGALDVWVSYSVLP